MRQGMAAAGVALADPLGTRLTAAQRQVDALTPSLLARDFRGAPVPQDPNDEPASAMFERLPARHHESKSRRDDRN